MAKLLGLIFYMTFIYYSYLAVYGLMLNRKQTLNKLYFLLSLSLAVWAISFAVSNVTLEYEEVLFWRRFASLGWGTSFSLIAHFFLVLVKREDKKMPIWLYVLLYFPSLVIVLVFGVIDSTALIQFNLVHNSWGWSNILPNNGWDMFYYIYYIGLSLMTVYFLLLRWKNSTNKVDRKGFSYILLSIVLAIVAGSLTEMILNRFVVTKIPSIAPIIILIPVTTILYFIRKQRILLPQVYNSLVENTLFLNDRSHKNFFNYVAGVFVAGSLFFILHSVYYSVNKLYIVLVSIATVVVGLVIYAIPKLNKSVQFEIRALTVIISVTVPIVLSTFLKDSLSNSIWPITILFLIITIIFNEEKMYKTIARVSTITFIVSWMLLPKEIVSIKLLDYISRVMIYLMGIVLAFYIHKTYTYKLIENKNQVKFHKILSSISASFVNVSENNLDELIEDMLKKISEAIGADRAYVGLLSDDNSSLFFRNEWLLENNPSVRSASKKLNISAFQWSTDQLNKNEIIFVNDPEALPDEAKAEKNIMLSNKISSFLYVPILIKNKPVGFIGFDKININSKWIVYNYELLKVNSNILSDALIKEKNEKEMHDLAFLDVLTNLPNRSLLSSRLDSAISYAKRKKLNVGVLFIDLDGFKAVNDTLGHNWGDKLLRIVSERLLAAVRLYDTVARFGGDEFIVMIPDISDLKYMEEVALKIMAVFEEPIGINHQNFHITASAGISVYPKDGTTGDALIKNADLAMYEAKNHGKNQYMWCTETMKSDIQNKMSITNALYLALDHGELSLVYQPQVSLESLEIVGVEALIRWHHPTYGFIPPSVFIPIAEQTGLIHKIGEWIIKEACHQSQVWQSLGLDPLRMAINLSIEQFKSGGLYKIITDIAKPMGLNPAYLEFEITEGIAMKESSQIKETLNEIKEFGATISIDDFGTAYSSFNRLQELPIDRLKIDMQFIRSIGVNPKDESLIKVMVYLAKSLGLDVIAEGVETKKQSDFLKHIACNEVQGYYYFKPMPGDQVTEILLTQNKVSVKII